MAVLSQQELLIIKQKVEILSGERGSPEQAAIRMIYLARLQELIGKLSQSATDVQLVVDKLTVDVGSVQTAIQSVQTDVTYIQTDVVDLKDDVVLLTTNIAQVQSDLASATIDLAALEQSIVDIQTGIGGLSGLPATVTALQLNVNTIKSDVTAVVIPVMNQGAVSGAPTQSEFNNLVGDVAALRAAIANIRTAIM